MIRSGQSCAMRPLCLMMNTSRYVTAAILALLHFALLRAAPGEPPAYSQVMFRRAIQKDHVSQTPGALVLTSSPLYVLFTERIDPSSKPAETCTLSTNLVSAIMVEHHLHDDQNGQREAAAMALSQPSRVFRFRSRRARQNVARTYTESQLDTARQLFGNHSPEELRRQAKVDLTRSADQQSPLTKLYRRPTANGVEISDSFRVAVAHVLLEHGILVGEDHDTGSLYLDEHD